MRIFSICIGSVSYFEDFLVSYRVTGDEMNQKVLEHDQAKSYDGFYSESDCLIVRNNHYLTIVESAHARLGPLLEDLTTESAQLFIVGVAKMGVAPHHPVATMPESTPAA